MDYAWLQVCVAENIAHAAAAAGQADLVAALAKWQGCFQTAAWNKRPGLFPLKGARVKHRQPRAGKGPHFGAPSCRKPLCARASFEEGMGKAAARW